MARIDGIENNGKAKMTLRKKNEAIRNVTHCLVDLLNKLLK
jgi:hypothetical protein